MMGMRWPATLQGLRGGGASFEGCSTPAERTSDPWSGARAASNPGCGEGVDGLDGGGVGGAKLLWQKAPMDLPLIATDNESSQTEFYTPSQARGLCVNQTS